MKIEVIPFGDIYEERFQLSKDYKLVEKFAGIWRVTEKCRKNYDPISFIQYLQGKIEKPDRVEKKVLSEKQILIGELLSM
jgi:hypothetical protein